MVNTGTLFRSGSTASKGKVGRAKGLDSRTFGEGFRMLLLEYIRGVDGCLGVCDPTVPTAPSVLDVGVLTKLRTSEKDSTAE